MQKAASLLEGSHDFSAFTLASSLKQQPWRNPVKDMSVKVTPGRAIMEEHIPEHTEHFHHVDLLFHANSFLYKQVCQQQGSYWKYIFSVVSILK